MADRKVQRLKNFKVSCVAILDQPSAVGAFGVYKSKEGQPSGMVGQALCKFVEAPGEEGLLYSLILVPDRVDRHGHWVSKEDTRAACHSWGSEGCPMDLNHGEEFGGKALTKSQVAAVENLIIQPGDERFKDITIDGEVVDPVGAWGTIVELRDEELKAKARAGKLNELSLYSPPGQFELVDEDLPTPGGDQETMSDEKLDTITKQLGDLTGSIAGLVKALTPPEKKEEEKKEEVKQEAAPDLTDLAVIAKMARDQEIVKLQKQFHIGDAAKQDLLGYRDALAKMYESEEAKDETASSVRTTTVENGKTSTTAKNTDTNLSAALAKSFFGKPQESK